jgi:hypothetical protein
MQPGIEHLSSHVLRLMDKGIRGIQNVQTLKWARQHKMLITWNVLCGFPGETPADYEEVIRFMRLIRHLTPPSSFAAFRLDRFSPMFDRPDDFGLSQIRPYRSYDLCYAGVPEEARARIAYFFTYRAQAQPATLAAINAAWAEVQDWKDEHRHSAFSAVVGEELLTLIDMRGGTTVRHQILMGEERLVYLGLDAIHSVASLTDWLRTNVPDQIWEEARVRNIVEAFVAQGLVLAEDDVFLALAVHVAADTSQDAEAIDIAAPSMKLGRVPEPLGA